MSKKREIELKSCFVFDEKDLSILLSNASADVCGVQWWKPANQADYDEAKAQLVAERKPATEDDVYTEDIWARMLINGKKLRLLDPESDWHWSGHKKGELLWSWQIANEGCEPVGGKWHSVGLADIAKAIVSYGKGHVANDCGADLRKINEDGDFWDADAVIQYAMYGDVIYG